MITNPRELEQLLKNDFGQAAQVEVRDDGAGWWRLSVTSDLFTSLDDENRMELLDEKLRKHDLNLGSYPIGAVRTYSPLETPSAPTSPLPFWSDALEAAGHDSESQSPRERITRCPIISFYSFKGGVGRSTALSITTSLLARENRKIVIIDFDLEAPGLTFFLNGEAREPSLEKTVGVLDFLHQYAYREVSEVRNVMKYVMPLRYDGPGRGEIYMVPAGEFSDEYVSRLSDLSWRKLYQDNKNPLRKFLKALDDALNPDIIIIDSRTGFADEGSVALLDLSDSCVICLSPTRQNYEGLTLISKAIKARQRLEGSPNVKFLLSPLASTDAQTKARWLLEFENWMRVNELIEPGTTEGEMFATIDYNPSVVGLSSLINSIPASISESYSSIAEFISTGLPKPSEEIGYEANPDLISQRVQILAELSSAPLNAAAADYSDDVLANIFQRTGDFNKFLQPTNFLVLGAKGTGKSMLYRLFVERSNEAKRLSGATKFENVEFVGIHGRRSSGSLLSKDEFSRLKDSMPSTLSAWESFWMAYLATSLMPQFEKEGDLLENNKTFAEEALSSVAQGPAAVGEFIGRAVSDPSLRGQIMSVIRQMNQHLLERGRTLWLFYDELDVIAPVIGNMGLEALMSWWIDTGEEFNAFRPKILLRKDIWKKLDFTNKSHYSSKLVELEWQEEDLLRLALRWCLTGSVTFAEFMKTTQKASLELLDQSPKEQLRNAASSIWGERMGKGQKAFSHNWVRTRVSDANGDSFPRSLSELLRIACTKEIENTQPFAENCLLRPKSLIDSISGVSQQRVDEFRQEYFELRNQLDALSGERSPIEFANLVRRWEVTELESRLYASALMAAGVFQDRQPKDEFGQKVFSVAELYLYGLNMVRKGQR